MFHERKKKKRGQRARSFVLQPHCKSIIPQGCIYIPTRTPSNFHRAWFAFSFLRGAPREISSIWDYEGLFSRVEKFSPLFTLVCFLSLLSFTENSVSSGVFASAFIIVENNFSYSNLLEEKRRIINFQEFIDK